MSEEMGVPGGSNEGLDLSNMLNMSEESVKLVSDAEFSKIARPEGVPFVQIDTQTFLQSMKVFVQRKTTAFDILSRSVFIDMSSGNIKASVTDGLFSMFVSFNVIEKTQDFPSEIIADLETLYKVVQVQGKEFYLIWKDGQLYIDFSGGQIFIPTYSIQKEVLTYKPIEAASTSEIGAESLLTSLQIASLYTASIEVPDLSYVFYDKEAMFLSNGVSVLKYSGEFCDMVIRKSDVSILVSALQLSVKEKLKVKFSVDKMSFGSSCMEIQIANVKATLSEEFKKLGVFAPKNYFSVDYARLSTVISIYERVPQSSGVVVFKAQNGVLKSTSKTRDGKESYVDLSNSLEGTLEFDLTLSAKNLLAALRSLRPAALVKFSTDKDYLYISVGSKNLCMFGKG